MLEHTPQNWRKSIEPSEAKAWTEKQDLTDTRFLDNLYFVIAASSFVVLITLYPSSHILCWGVLWKGF